MNVRRRSAVLVDVPNSNPNEPDTHKTRGGVVIDESGGVSTVAYITKVKRYEDSVVVRKNTKGIGFALRIQYDSYFNGDVVRVPTDSLKEACFVDEALCSQIFDVATKKLNR